MKLGFEENITKKSSLVGVVLASFGSFDLLVQVLFHLLSKGRVLFFFNLREII